jgi:putative membrane protein
MILEALLSYAHLLAILTLVVFATSEAALCRAEWMNAQVVERLVVVDRIYGMAALAVLVTGVVRTWLGAKGMGWYWTNPLLYVKVVLFVLAGLLSIKPSIAIARWHGALQADGTLPAADEIRSTRKLVMIQVHIVAIIPLASVFLARGYGD